MITFDTGTAERLGVLEPYAEVRADGPPVIVIDHHARGSAFGSMRMVDAGAAATAELIADLIDELGVPVDEAIATCLYAGLASDTGSFRYAATSPASHRLAARLLEAGARHDTISTLLWDTRPASYLRVLSGALDRLQHSGEVIWTYVTCADLSAAGATAEETEGIVDVIRGSREHEVAVVLKQDAGRRPRLLEGVGALPGPPRRRRRVHRARRRRPSAGCRFQRRRHPAADHRPAAGSTFRRPVSRA